MIPSTIILIVHFVYTYFKVFQHIYRYTKVAHQRVERDLYRYKPLLLDPGSLVSMVTLEMSLGTSESTYNTFPVWKTDSSGSNLQDEYQTNFSAKPVVTVSKTIIELDIKLKIVAKYNMSFTMT